MKLFVILTVCMYAVHAKDQYVSDTLKPLTDEMIKAINALNTTWKAGKNFAKSPLVELDKLVVTHEEILYDDFPVEVSSSGLATQFDARTKWPNCTSIGKIFDQKKGYPGWIYPAVSSMADRICIKYNIHIDVEATVEQIMRSHGNLTNNYNSANIGQAFNYWSKHGIYPVANNYNCLPFDKECQIKLNKYYEVFVKSRDSCYNVMRDIIANGPLAAYMQVYSDFPNYISGIYKRVSKNYIGMHNVKLIGWGVENGTDYWLATNSWGSDWGNQGTFKIRRCTNEFGENPNAPAVTFLEREVPSFSEDLLFKLA